MSWLSSALGGAKKAVTGVGHAIGSVAKNPLVDAGIGAFFGPWAGAAAGGLGTLMAPGGNLGEAAKGALVGGASGLAGQGVRRVVGGMMGGGSDPSGVSSDPANASVGGGAPGGGAMDALGGVVNGVKRALPSAIGGGGGMSGMQAIMAALAAAQAANAAKASGRAGDFQNKATDLAEQNWAAGAPLRTQGQARLLDPTRPNLSSTYTNDANPFARKRVLG